MILEKELNELKKGIEDNQKLINEKFKQIDEKLIKAGKTLERTEYLIKNFGETK